MGYQHATITDCHLYIFQPASQQSAVPPSPPNHNVMAHDIISFGMANLPLAFFFSFSELWTFIKSDRVTSGKGCTGTGLGHTQWVGPGGSRGFRGRKVLLFQSRLNITIIKLQSYSAALVNGERSVARTQGGAWVLSFSLNTSVGCLC